MAIALVSGQHAAIDGTTTSFGVAFPSNVTAGNFIAVSATQWETPETATITDSLSNTYNEAIQVTLGDNRNQNIYSFNIAGGANTVTTSGTSDDRSIVIQEFSGVQTSSDPIDADTSSGTGNNSSPNAGSITPAAGNHLYIGCFGDETNAASKTAGGGYTKVLSEISSNNFAPNFMLFKIASGVQTAQATMGASSDWVATSAAFIEDAGGPTTTPKTLTYTGVGSSSLSLAVTHFRSISMSGIGTNSLSTTATHSHSASMTGIGTVSISKTIKKTLGAIAVGTNNIVKKISKTLGYTAVGTAAEQESVIIPQSASSTGTGTSSLSTLFIPAGEAVARFIRRIGIKLGIGL